MPAARHFSRSPFMALAVMATMGVRRPPPSLSRIRAVASKPSISGIWPSMSTASYRVRATASTASLPLSATSTR